VHAFAVGLNLVVVWRGGRGRVHAFACGGPQPGGVCERSVSTSRGR